jgi:ABC-type Fe3+ transport system permease subunit
MTRDLRVFRREIDIPRKIKRSFQRQTAAWVTAAVVVGVLVIVLPARRKRTVYVKTKVRRGDKGSQNKLVEAGFALGALKFAASMLKPVVVSFITKKMRDYVDASQAKPPKRRSLI